jgi:hypothetical protein
VALGTAFIRQGKLEQGLAELRRAAAGRMMPLSRSTRWRATGSRNLGGMVVLASEGHDAQAQDKLIDALSDVYTSRGIQTMAFQSANGFRDKGRALFSALGYLLLTMVILAAFGAPLDFSYSVSGVILWLAMARASLWPALNAARVSVREALAYE